MDVPAADMPPPLQPLQAVLSLKVPAGQSPEQNIAPLSEASPGVQALHTSIPASDEYVPASQNEQRPVVPSPKAPAAQTVHEAEPVDAAPLPAVQFWHFMAPTSPA